MISLDKAIQISGSELGGSVTFNEEHDEALSIAHDALVKIKTGQIVLRQIAVKHMIDLLLELHILCPKDKLGKDNSYGKACRCKEFYKRMEEKKMEICKNWESEKDGLWLKITCKEGHKLTKDCYMGGDRECFEKEAYDKTDIGRTVS